MGRSRSARLQAIVKQEALDGLSLELDEETLVYICEILDQSDVGDEERAETVAGILELQLSAVEGLSDDAVPSSRIQTVTSSILAAAADAQDSGSSSSSSEVDDPDQDTAAAPLEDLASLPPRQPRPDEPSDALARRKAILAAYGSVEDDLADDPRAAAAAAKLSAEKDAAARDLMISDRIKMLDLKKKTRRKAEAKQGADLLSPNLNTAVAAKEVAARREVDAKKASEKRAKDKADLTRQRADQAQRKADRTKAAAKGERRA